jgi:hypothetical protein
MKDYKLNKKNIKNFINNSDIEIKQIVKKIIRNTKYVSNKDFFYKLNKNIKHLLEKTKNNKVIYVYINENNTKTSNYWLYSYLKKILKSKLITINSSNIKTLKKDDYVVFIDDCIYSGNQLGGIIAGFMYDNKEQIKYKLNIYVLVSYISTDGKKFIKTVFKNNNEQKKYKLFFNKYVYKLKSTTKILTKEEIELMNAYYPRIKLMDIDSRRQYFEDKQLIYFQHKLADGTSTISLFYKGLVPNKHNLEILSNYTDDDFDKLMIYPLILNCKYSKHFNNQCPLPPYKK